MIYWILFIFCIAAGTIAVASESHTIGFYVVLLYLSVIVNLLADILKELKRK